MGKCQKMQPTLLFITLNSTVFFLGLHSFRYDGRYQEKCIVSLMLGKLHYLWGRGGRYPGKGFIQCHKLCFGILWSTPFAHFSVIAVLANLAAQNFSPTTKQTSKKFRPLRNARPKNFAHSERRLPKKSEIHHRVLCALYSPILSIRLFSLCNKIISVQ